MKLYIAAIYTSNFGKSSQAYLRQTDKERAGRDSVRHYLESYHYIHKQTYVDKIKADGIKVFLDSGAFSAFTQGATIDLPGYVDYIKRNWEIVEIDDGIPLFSVLDGIGDPLKTYQNQWLMEQMGVRPLPCFHYGEDERYLEDYMRRYPYITIGGMVPIETRPLIEWLDRLWESYLVDGSGRPKLKIHGFGLTQIGIMERYPWYSVDSSSWVQIAANGGIWIPQWGSIFISRNSPAAKIAGRHIDTIPAQQREAIKKYIESIGYDVERLQVDYISRWSFNCWSYTELNNITMREGKTFKRDQLDIFKDFDACSMNLISQGVQ